MAVCAVACLPLLAGDAAVPPAPFGIQVVDEQTGRGVPLVELETVNRLQFITDSAGWVAFAEPGLMEQKVSVVQRLSSLQTTGTVQRIKASAPGPDDSLDLANHLTDASFVTTFYSHPRRLPEIEATRISIRQCGALRRHERLPPLLHRPAHLPDRLEPLLASQRDDRGTSSQRAG